MELPDYETSPNSELLRLLSEKGFTSWYTFHDESGFYSALGFCLMLHTYHKYPANDKYIRETWLPNIVAPLKEVEDHYSSSKKYSIPEYWDGLKQQCKNICLVIFSNKEHVKSRIAAGRMLEPDQKGYYEDIVKHFRICLSLHVMVEGRPKTYNYVLGNPNQSVFFVDLAMEGGKIMALIHKDLSWGTIEKPAFPFYMQLGSKDGPTPVILTSSEFREAPPPDPMVIIRNLISMTTLISRMMLTGMPAVPHSQREALEQLNAVHKEMAPLVKRYFPECNLDGDELARVLALPVIEEVKERPPHTLDTCALYTEVSDSQISFHTHSVHVMCLQLFLEVKFNERDCTLTCPIESCKLPISTDIVKQFPDLYSKYKFIKDQTVIAATTVGMQLMCPACEHAVSQAQICELAHKCKLCSHCYLQSWESQICKKCNSQLTSADYDQMREFYYRLQADSTSSSLPT